MSSDDCEMVSVRDVVDVSCVQVPPLAHGIDAHKLDSVQKTPDCAGAHTQLEPEQVAPVAHGDDEQKSYVSEQVEPARPAGQVQRIPVLRGAHVPPDSHGDDAHSSMAMSQRVPV